jgi:hypothetical protein
VAQKATKIKRYAARGQLQPRFPAYAADFLRYRGNRPDRTVALKHVQKKCSAFLGSDMPQLFDFERVLSAALLHRQTGLGAVEHLDLALLIYREDDGVAGGST